MVPGATLRRSVCSLTLIAAAARGRSRDVRSGLSTTGPRGFRIGYGAYPFVASRHASRAAGAWHNAATAPPCSTAASSAPVRYRPERRPQLRARAWDCGLSGSLCRPPAAAGATLLSRMAAGTVVVREAACPDFRVSYESKVCNAKCIKCAYPFNVHPIVPLLAALLSVLGCPRPHHPPQTPRRHCSPQPR